MKNLRNLGLAIAAFFALASCSSDDDATAPVLTPTPTPAQNNIVQTAQATPSLSLLVEALVKADLVEALSANGDKTVFAPSNTAFEDFLVTNGFVDSNGDADLDTVPVAALKQVLLNHVIDGSNILSIDIEGTTGYISTLADGPENTKLSMYFDAINNGVVLNGNSTVTDANIMTSNGVVHIVDEVIGLPTIATFATIDPKLSILVEALIYADSNPSTNTIEYIDNVSDADFGPLTVFAPSNTAFIELLDELNISALTDLDTATVDSVLLLHIINNTNITSSELSSGTVTTLGGDITINASALTLTDSMNRISNLDDILIDIQATNGVVHVIDKVLRP